MFIKNHPNYRIAWAILTFVCLGAIASQARPLVDYVPADYDLTVQVDVRQCFEDPELAAVRERLMDPGVTAMLDAIDQMTGIDFRNDVDRVALAAYFDKSRESQNLFFMRGRWDEGALLSMLLEMPEYYEESYEGQTIFGFWAEDEARMRYVCFLEKDAMVLGGLEPVQSVTRAVENESMRFAADPACKTLQSDGKVSDPIVTVTGLSVPPDPNRDAFGNALMAGVEGFRLNIAAGDAPEGKLTVLTSDGQTAALKAEALEGLLAVVQMIEEQPLLAKVATTVSVETDDSLVTAHSRMDWDQIYRLLAMHPALHGLKR